MIRRRPRSRTRILGHWDVPAGHDAGVQSSTAIRAGPAASAILLLLVVASCTSGSGSTTSTPPPTSSSPVVARPTSCPATHLTPPPVAGSQQEMVPGSPAVAVECFGKRRAVLSGSELTTLVSQLNGLEHASANTPICLALGPSYFVYFTYGSGSVQLVQVPTICALVTNGQLLAHPTDALIGWLHDRLPG